MTASADTPGRGSSVADDIVLRFRGRWLADGSDVAVVLGTVAPDVKSQPTQDEHGDIDGYEVRLPYGLPRWRIIRRRARRRTVVRELLGATITPHATAAP